MSYTPADQRLIQSGQSWNLALGVKGKLRFWHNREKYLDDLASLSSGIFGRLHHQGVEINEGYAKAERARQADAKAQAQTPSPEEREQKAQKYISSMVGNANTEEEWKTLEQKLCEASWVTQKDKDYFTGLRMAWEARNAREA